MPKVRYSFENFLDDWNLPNLRKLDLAMPPSPAAPSLLDVPNPNAPSLPASVALVELGTEEQPQRERGLFETLLGSPEALYQDAVEHPEKYSAETIALLRALVSGTKKQSELTPEERRMLDLGTIDFATAPAKPKRRRAPERARPVLELEAGGASRGRGGAPEPGVDVPREAVAPYWWMK
jgi:hypothetical protein